MNSQNLKYFFQFLPIWCLDQILLAIPRSWTIRIGERLGWLLSLFMRKRRKLILANLKMAFPEKSERERRKIMKGVWKNIGRVAGEFIRQSEVNPENFREYLEVVGEDAVKKAKALGKGVIYVGFHYGNWEMSGIGVNALDSVLAVARPVKNPFVDRWVKAKRGQAKMKVILHRRAVKECLQALKQKHSVGILVDQNLYHGGMFMKFFGRWAATTPLPGLLYSRTGAPIVIAYCRRRGNKLQVVFDDSIAIPKNLEGNELMERITQLISTRLEEIIREKPEDWFWIHNRWKRQPTLDEIPKQ